MAPTQIKTPSTKIVKGKKPGPPPSSKSTGMSASISAGSKSILPLKEIFGGHSQDLVNAAKEGKRTHPNNIRESGRPLEKAVQNLFVNSIPPTYAAVSGFIFDDVTFELSNQLDFLLYEQSKTLRLPPSKSLNESYVSAKSIRCFGQIKNTATPKLIKEALNQHEETLKRFVRGASLTSFIVFGLGSRKKVKSILKSHTGPLPSIILCLEDGGVFYSNEPLRRLEEYTLIGTSDPGLSFLFFFCKMLMNIDMHNSPSFVKSLKSVLLKYKFAPSD